MRSIFLTLFLLTLLTLLTLVLIILITHKPASIADVVIVGAGLAGLHAAEQLHRHGYSVCVLEARDRICGKIVGGRGGVDQGAQWVGRKHHRVINLARRFGLRLFPSSISEPLDRHGEYALVWHDNRVLRLHDYSSESLRKVVNGQTVDTYEKAVKHFENRVNRNEKSRLCEKCQQSLRRWLEREMGDDTDAQALFRLFWSNELAMSADDLTLQNMVDQIDMSPVDTPVEKWRIQGGASQLCDGLARPIEKFIHLNQPVTRIRFDNRSDLFEIRTSSASTFHGRQVIIAVPSHILVEGIDTAGMIENRSPTVRGHVIKIHITFSTPFWRERGLNGYALFPFGHVINQTVDNSVPGEDEGILGVFMVADTAKEMDKFSPSERREKVLKEIEIVFGSLPQIVDYQEYLWDADKWTSGGWQTIADVVSHHPRLHIAGTDFATEWNGYMEGALKSADHAVKQAMRR